MIDYDKEHELLKQAYWFAENKMIDTAIALVEEAFDNFNQFRAWYLTNRDTEYSLFTDKFFNNWVAKIMVLMYNGHCSENEQALINMTRYELGI